MHILEKIPLFCSSYSLLIIIAILLKIDLKTINFHIGILLTPILILIILGYVFLYNNINRHSTGGESHKICAVENKNDMMHTYLLPYLIFILTFIPMPNLGLEQIIAIFVFLAILFVVYIRSDLFLFDIMLIILGYSYYKVTSETNSFIVISNVNLYEKLNNALYFRLIDENLFKYGE